LKKTHLNAEIKKDGRLPQSDHGFSFSSVVVCNRSKKVNKQKICETFDSSQQFKDFLLENIHEVYQARLTPI
jgi:hypothetical protein